MTVPVPPTKRPRPENSNVFAVRLEADDAARLRSVAHGYNASMADTFRTAIKFYLDAIESEGPS